MRVSTRRSSEGGFAIIELILVLVIIAGVVGVGAYVLKQRQSATNLASTTPTATAATKSVANVAAAGTSAAIDQLTSAETQSEKGASVGADGQIQQDALSANSSASNVGGAYNETNF